MQPCNANGSESESGLPYTVTNCNCNDTTAPIVKTRTQYYEHTAYPHVYQHYYWGAFTYNPFTCRDVPFENRNKFIVDYNIAHKPRGSLVQFARIAYDIRQLVHEVNKHDYFDHLEEYRTVDGKYILIVSPYAITPDGREVLTELGFQQIYNLYSDSATTWIRIFPSIREVTACKKLYKIRAKKKNSTAIDHHPYFIKEFTRQINSQIDRKIIQLDLMAEDPPIITTLLRNEYM